MSVPLTYTGTPLGTLVAYERAAAGLPPAAPSSAAAPSPSPSPSPLAYADNVPLFLQDLGYAWAVLDPSTAAAGGAGEGEGAAAPVTAPTPADRSWARDVVAQANTFTARKKLHSALKTLSKKMSKALKTEAQQAASRVRSASANTGRRGSSLSALNDTATTSSSGGALSSPGASLAAAAAGGSAVPLPSAPKDRVFAELLLSAMRRVLKDEAKAQEKARKEREKAEKRRAKEERKRRKHGDRGGGDASSSLSSSASPTNGSSWGDSRSELGTSALTARRSSMLCVALLEAYAEALSAPLVPLIISRQLEGASRSADGGAAAARRLVEESFRQHDPTAYATLYFISSLLRAHSAHAPADSAARLCASVVREPALQSAGGILASCLNIGTAQPPPPPSQQQQQQVDQGLLADPTTTTTATAAAAQQSAEGTSLTGGEETTRRRRRRRRPRVAGEDAETATESLQIPPEQQRPVDREEQKEEEAADAPTPEPVSVGTEGDGESLAVPPIDSAPQPVGATMPAVGAMAAMLGDSDSSDDDDTTDTNTTYTSVATPRAAESIHINRESNNNGDVASSSSSTSDESSFVPKKVALPAVAAAAAAPTQREGFGRMLGGLASSSSASSTSSVFPTAASRPGPVTTTTTTTAAVVQAATAPSAGAAALAGGDAEVATSTSTTATTADARARLAAQGTALGEKRPAEVASTRPAAAPQQQQPQRTHHMWESTSSDTESRATASDFDDDGEEDEAGAGWGRAAGSVAATVAEAEALLLSADAAAGGPLSGKDDPLSCPELPLGSPTGSAASPLAVAATAAATAGPAATASSAGSATSRSSSTASAEATPQQRGSAHCTPNRSEQQHREEGGRQGGPVVATAAAAPPALQLRTPSSPTSPTQPGGGGQGQPPLAPHTQSRRSSSPTGLLQAAAAAPAVKSSQSGSTSALSLLSTPKLSAIMATGATPTMLDEGERHATFLRPSTARQPSTGESSSSPHTLQASTTAGGDAVANAAAGGKQRTPLPQGARDEGKGAPQAKRIERGGDGAAGAQPASALGGRRLVFSASPNRGTTADEADDEGREWVYEGAVRPLAGGGSGQMVPPTSSSASTAPSYYSSSSSASPSPSEGGGEARGLAAGAAEESGGDDDDEFDVAFAPDKEPVKPPQEEAGEKEAEGERGDERVLSMPEASPLVHVQPAEPVSTPPTASPPPPPPPHPEPAQVPAAAAPSSSVKTVSAQSTPPVRPVAAEQAEALSTPKPSPAARSLGSPAGASTPGLRSVDTPESSVSPASPPSLLSHLEQQEQTQPRVVALRSAKQLFLQGYHRPSPSSQPRHHDVAAPTPQRPLGREDSSSIGDAPYLRPGSPVADGHTAAASDAETTVAELVSRLHQRGDRSSHEAATLLASLLETVRSGDGHGGGASTLSHASTAVAVGATATDGSHNYPTSASRHDSNTRIFLDQSALSQWQAQGPPQPQAGDAGQVRPPHPNTERQPTAQAAQPRDARVDLGPTATERALRTLQQKVAALEKALQERRAAEEQHADAAARDYAASKDLEMQLHAAAEKLAALQREQVHAERGDRLTAAKIRDLEYQIESFREEQLKLRMLLTETQAQNETLRRALVFDEAPLTRA